MKLVITEVIRAEPVHQVTQRRIAQRVLERRRVGLVIFIAWWEPVRAAQIARTDIQAAEVDRHVADIRRAGGGVVGLGVQEVELDIPAARIAADSDALNARILDGFVNGSSFRILGPALCE
ncbi:MAG: hypothetical protein K8E66_12315, partial [Phycisphaerales bacterium]|nr:hypothetical protein [Phycisphaerales bacterium]